jgi:hypothetical protein
MTEEEANREPVKKKSKYKKLKKKLRELLAWKLEVEYEDRQSRRIKALVAKLKASPDKWRLVSCLLNDQPVAYRIIIDNGTMKVGMGGTVDRCIVNKSPGNGIELGTNCVCTNTIVDSCGGTGIQSSDGCMCDGCVVSGSGKAGFSATK